MAPERVGDHLLEGLPAERGKVLECALATEPSGAGHRVDEGGHHDGGGAETQRDDGELEGHCAESIPGSGGPAVRPEPPVVVAPGGGRREQLELAEAQPGHPPAPSAHTVSDHDPPRAPAADPGTAAAHAD